MATSADSLTVSPWSSRNTALEPVSAAGTIACAYTISTGVDDVVVALFFARHDGRDQLWVRSEYDGAVEAILSLGKTVLFRQLLAARENLDVSVWCAVEGASGGTPRQSCVVMVEALLRAQGSHVRHLTVAQETILNEADLSKIVGAMDKEARKRSREAQLMRGAAIIRLASELGLSPSHSGGSPSSWLCQCPGTSHWLMINAQSGEWGCGYCCRKGWAPDLVEFASSRKAGSVSGN